MKTFSKLAYLFLSITAIGTLTNCGEDTEPDGSISITLEATSAFQADNTDQTVTTVTWGCVVLNESLTACIYNYNGEIQIDGKISNDALEAGPGSAGITFVPANTTFSELEGGPRTYSLFVGRFDNTSGNSIELLELSGDLDLYASPGVDEAWTVNFGTGGAPVVSN